jgi:uncharacterized membrane protein
MDNTKLKKSFLIIGFLVLFVGLAVVVIDSKQTGKIPDVFKGFLVGLGISLVLCSFILKRFKKQQAN